MKFPIGSSTDQADGSYSEIWLKPVKYVPDPFRGGDNILCLCETLNAKTMEPIETNKRARAAKIFEQKEVAEEETWYGLEQEYTLFDSTGTVPLGWPNNGFPAPQVCYILSDEGDLSIHITISSHIDSGLFPVVFGFGIFPIFNFGILSIAYAFSG